MEKFQVETEDGRTFEVQPFQEDKEVKYKVNVNGHVITFASNANSDIVPISPGALMDRHLLFAIGNKIESHYL